MNARAADKGPARLVVPCIKTLEGPGTWVFSFVARIGQVKRFAVLGAPSGPEPLLSRSLASALDLAKAAVPGSLVIGFNGRLDFRLQSRINGRNSVGELCLKTGRGKTGFLAEGRLERFGPASSGAIIPILAYELPSREETP